MLIVAGTLLALAQAGPSDEEAEAFARAFLADVLQGRTTAVDARCDQAAMVSTAVQGLDVDEAVVRGFRLGMSKKSAGFGFGAVLKTALEAGGSYTLLRVRRIDGRPRALFRLVGPDGFNYHDFILEGSPTRFVDVHIYATGDRMSELSRSMLLLTMSAQPSALQRALGRKDGAADMRALIDCQKLFQQGRYPETYAAVEKLPAAMRKEKYVQFMRCRSAVDVGKAEADAAFSDFRALFPDEPCLDMLSIDVHVMTKRYPDALASIDRLDARLGGDPHLDVIRANLRYAAGEPAKAVEHCRKAVAAEKTLRPAYETLLSLLLMAKNFAGVAETLTAYERDAGVELNDVTAVEGYEEFVKSDAGRAWLAAREKK